MTTPSEATPESRRDGYFPIDGVMCRRCGEVADPGLTECPVCEAAVWCVEIEPCPLPVDRRFRLNVSHCRSEHHHYGRGDHVRLLTRTGRELR